MEINKEAQETILEVMADTINTLKQELKKTQYGSHDWQREEIQRLENELNPLREKNNELSQYVNEITKEINNWYAYKRRVNTAVNYHCRNCPKLKKKCKKQEVFIDFSLSKEEAQTSKKAQEEANKNTENCTLYKYRDSNETIERL